MKYTALQYWTAANELTTNAQLALMIAKPSRHLRAKYLAGFIKDRLSDTRFRPFKRDMKRLIAVYKRQPEFLHTELERIHEQCQHQRQNWSDADMLYQFFHYLAEHHDLSSSVDESADAPHILITKSERVQQSLPSNTDMVKPLVLWINQPQVVPPVFYGTASLFGFAVTCRYHNDTLFVRLSKESV
ncbi:DUF2913 family protein [Vibrio mediterranei]|uniref:DUF2913 family protein n=1 Tax=Vibrio mediterranei TaxID=689 RepID=UPI0038CE46F6